MNADRVLLVGAGGHARACIDVIEQQGRFRIAGLIGTQAEAGTIVLGYEVLGTDADLPRLRDAHLHALVVIGQISTPDRRREAFRALESAGYALATVVSPRAYVSPHATIGAGTIVMHGAVVNAGARVGRNCILNSQCLVEHDAAIADHCHISTGALVNGGVRVGAGTFIGSGSSVKQDVTIGDGCVVGMGSRVLRDCEPGSLHVQSAALS